MEFSFDDFSFIIIHSPGGAGAWFGFNSNRANIIFHARQLTTHLLDTHIHAPQYPNLGLFGQSTLLDWLEKYTFPVESSFASLAKAKKIYPRCVASTLSHGTTTAAYFATTHVESTNLLASICLNKGQRAFIGRCNMDSKMNPDYYRDASAESAISDTQATIEHIKRIDPSFELISPIITPRFAPSCSPALLVSLGALAAQTDLPIQTHIAENPSEVALVARVFPSHDSYAAVYYGHGLLTSRSVLGHAVHLSHSERKLISQCGSSVSHCPVSNSSLSSGICPVRELLDQGIKVGLGTDVSGGWSPSILVVAREAAMVSRTLAAFGRDFGVGERELRNDETHEENLSSGKDAGSGGTHREPQSSQKDHCDELYERKKLSIEECLYLATFGGAKCLGLEKKVGRFEVGMDWDAQMIKLEDFSTDAGESEHNISDEAMDETLVDHREGRLRNNDGGPVELWGTEKWADKVAKWAFCGDDRNTRKVWVKGRLVHER